MAFISKYVSRRFI